MTQVGVRPASLLRQLRRLEGDVGEVGSILIGVLKGRMEDSQEIESCLEWEAVLRTVELLVGNFVMSGMSVLVNE